MNKIGKKLKDIRTAKKFTLKELSDVTGFSISFLSDVEREKKNPSFENILILSEKLDAPYDYFISSKKTIYDQAIDEGWLDILELLSDYSNWNQIDRDELKTYLSAKKIIRNSKKN